MPTKVIDSDGDIRNWPADFVAKLRDTIVGRKAFKEGEIKSIAEKSSINTSIQFDNDAFVEEGLKVLEGIEKEKILDLAKRGKPEPIMYRALQRSRIYNDVKDFTLEDMENSDNLLKIIGYSLFGKVTEEEPQLSVEPMEYEDTEEAQQYISSLRNIPQRADLGADAPSLPAMFMKSPVLEEKFRLNIDKSLANIEIISTARDKQDFYFAEYNNTSERENFLKRVYPNVNYKPNGKKINTSDPKTKITKLSKDIELDETYMDGLREKLSEETSQEEIESYVGDKLKEIFSERISELKRYLAEQNKATPLRNEEYEIYLTSTLKQISPRDKTKSFKIGVSIKSKEVGTFDISPFSKPRRSRTKKKEKGELLSSALEEELSAMDANMKEDYRMAIEEYMEKDSRNDIDDEALDEMKQKYGFEMDKVIEIIGNAKSSSDKRFEQQKTTLVSEEYRFNEPLADHIEEIMDRFDDTKTQIEEGA
jgi:hypothetical protein